AKALAGARLETAGAADGAGACTLISGGWLGARCTPRVLRAARAMAAQRGALAAVVERPVDSPLVQIQVPDSRLALALMASRFHGRPSRHLTLVGITGTNGKTTVSYLVEALLSQRGPAGLVGTVEQRYPGKRRASAMTTPESVELQAALAEMHAAGVKGVAMEVSSHALQQHRVDGCRFDAAVFTNLSRDHLDYHGDMAAYFQAKRRLFSQLLPQAKRAGKDPAAVICADDPKGSHLAGETTGLHLRTLTYGFSPAARVRGEAPQMSLRGSRCRVRWPAGSFDLATPLVGPYNLQNALAATAVGLALDFEPEQIQRALASVKGVPGRLQPVAGVPGGPTVLVDYAHSDQALASVLLALRPLTPGRLICVFGAGGDRDQGKRPLMGQAVGAGADLAVLTSDNPRSEDPQAIMAMVEPGLGIAGACRVSALGGEGPAYLCEPDRATAIALAIDAAGPEDVVLIAGKGHEDYQIVGQTRRHFDDREQAAAALARRGAGEAGHAGS
ncbi:MAG: UDP-N-acetylmuramoyl-L-alanyl-D-glutamate--2,6-diaminopimelate ligase, partial [Proteobacteria bacterium]|nr:UDP-N-acetylmuramoyl-L-alanyl-D-glutamate--2,6-diaminopimelate ligase [Pseudomonadota bacterium]